MTESEFYRTKEELLENISELFLKYGLRSTSMDDICSHLKISKKTLYQFFRNKDDVAEQVFLHQRNSRSRKDLEELKQHNAIQIMLAIRNHIITSLNSRMPANLFDLKKYHPDVYQRINDHDHSFIRDVLLEVINKGIREGYFRTDANKEVQVYLFIKQIAFLGEPEMISEIKYPLDIIISTIMENFIRSFATPQGTNELEKLLNKQEK